MSRPSLYLTLCFLLWMTPTPLPAQDQIAEWLELAKQHYKVQPDSAVFYAIKARDAARNSGDQKGLADASLSMAKNYNQQGFYEEALAADSVALANYRALNDLDGESSTRINIGLVLLNKGAFVPAAEEFLAVHALSDSLNDLHGLAAASSNLGIVYGRTGNFEKSASYFEEAIRHYEADDDTARVISTLLNLGITYLQAGDQAKGMELFQKNYDMALVYGDPEIIANASMNLGSLNYDLGNFEESKKWMTTAIDHYTTLNNLKGIAQAKGNLCMVCLELGQTAMAIEACETAQQNAEQINAHDVLRDIYDQLTALYTKTGDYKKATEYQQLYRALNDSLFTVEQNTLADELERKYKTQKMALEIDNLEQRNKLTELEKQQTQHDLSVTKSNNKILALVLGVVALLALSGFLLFNFYQQKKKAKLREKALEIEQRLLRSQMNPHFIFNSMNSIQSYIAENNSYKAEVYLSKFAQLMRNILSNSRLTLISLADEVETLRLYMELEQERFRGKFDFEINIHSDLEDDLVAVPPLIVQPYVENAILHGVQALESAGRIEVNFTEKDNFLYCEVIDNGIGREKAGAIASQKKREHKSVSMDLTKDRLSMLQEGGASQGAIHIHDLENADGEAAGTKIELILPLTFL